MGIATDERSTKSERTPAIPPGARMDTARPLIRAGRAAWIWPVLLTSLALALRLYRLGEESLWLDEGYSIADVNHFDPTQYAQNVRPLYYLFLWVWMRLGHSEFFLRLPSALFGAAAVLALYSLAGKLVGERAGITASLLMAISPLMVNHSQEVRMYSLVTLLTVLAMHQFVLLLHTQKRKYMVGYAVFTALSVATFPPSGSLLLVQNCMAMLSMPGRKWTKMLVAECLLILPFTHMFPRITAFAQGLAPDGVSGPSFLDVVSIVGTFSLLTPGTRGTVTWIAFNAYTFGTLALIAFGIWQVRRRRGISTQTLTSLLLWLIIPVALMAELARLTGAQWLPRYVIYSAPAYFLLIGAGLARIPKRSIRCLALAVVLAFPAVRLARYYERPMHPQWREAVRFVTERERPGDVIALYRPGNGVVFGYYYRGRSPWIEIGQPKLQKRRPWTEDRAKNLLGDLDAKHRRVWLVMSECDPAAGRAIRAHVRKSDRVLLTRSYAQIDVLLFARRGA